MLGNIIDSRKNKYAAARLNIVMEPSAHDNSIEGADQHSWVTNAGDCDVFYNVSLGEAIAKASAMVGAVTIFLYDIDVDPMEAEPVIIAAEPVIIEEYNSCGCLQPWCSSCN